MRARTDPDGSLLLTYDSAWISTALFALASVLIAMAAYDYFIGPRGTDRLFGIFGGVATCGISGFVMLEQGRFRLDPRTRTIEWTRRWGFRRRSGTVSFDEVKAVVAEQPIVDGYIPSRRLVLTTHDGRSIPLTVSYGSDRAGVVLRIADQARAMVESGGRPTDHRQP